MADIVEYRTNDRRDGDKLDALGVHAEEEGFGIGADEIDLAQVEDSFAAGRGGTRGLPTLFEFGHPRS